MLARQETSMHIFTKNDFLALLRLLALPLNIRNWQKFHWLMLTILPFIAACAGNNDVEVWSEGAEIKVANNTPGAIYYQLLNGDGFVGSEKDRRCKFDGTYLASGDVSTFPRPKDQALEDYRLSWWYPNLLIPDLMCSEVQVNTIKVSLDYLRATQEGDDEALDSTTIAFDEEDESSFDDDDGIYENYDEF